MPKNSYCASRGESKVEQEKVSDRIYNTCIIYFGNGGDRSRGRHVWLSEMEYRRSRKRR